MPQNDDLASQLIEPIAEAARAAIAAGNDAKADLARRDAENVAKAIATANKAARTGNAAQAEQAQRTAQRILQRYAAPGNPIPREAKAQAKKAVAALKRDTELSRRIKRTEAKIRAIQRSRRRRR